MAPGPAGFPSRQSGQPGRKVAVPAATAVIPTGIAGLLAPAAVRDRMPLGRDRCRPSVPKRPAVLPPIVPRVHSGAGASSGTTPHPAAAPQTPANSEAKA